jgi:hypothetical protein
MMKSSISIVLNNRVDGARGMSINAHAAAPALSFGRRQGRSVNR